MAKKKSSTSKTPNNAWRDTFERQADRVWAYEMYRSKTLGIPAIMDKYKEKYGREVDRRTVWRDITAGGKDWFNENYGASKGSKVIKNMITSKHMLQRKIEAAINICLQSHEDTITETTQAEDESKLKVVREMVKITKSKNFNFDKLIDAHMKVDREILYLMNILDKNGWEDYSFEGNKEEVLPENTPAGLVPDDEANSNGKPIYQILLPENNRDKKTS